MKIQNRSFLKTCKHTWSLCFVVGFWICLFSLMHFRDFSVTIQQKVVTKYLLFFLRLKCFIIWSIYLHLILCLLVYFALSDFFVVITLCSQTHINTHCTQNVGQRVRGLHEKQLLLWTPSDDDQPSMNLHLTYTPREKGGVYKTLGAFKLLLLAAHRSASSKPNWDTAGLKPPLNLS